MVRLFGRNMKVEGSLVNVVPEGEELVFNFGNYEVRVKEANDKLKASVKRAKPHRAKFADIYLESGEVQISNTDPSVMDKIKAAPQSRAVTKEEVLAANAAK